MFDIAGGNSDLRKIIDLRDRSSKVVPFCTQDPLNPENTVSGLLCRIPDYRYGALVIEKVNDRPTVPQLIYATPKLYYPFNRSVDPDQFFWPDDVREAHVYEKFDGTNVFVFSYANAEGKRFVSAKLRLAPFLRNGSFGRFLDMWIEEMGDIRWPTKIVQGTMGLSFEMYGKRNSLLVNYPFPLAISLLFCVTSRGKILPPSEAPFYSKVIDQTNPVVTATMETGSGLTDVYRRMQELAEKANKNAVAAKKVDFAITEGFVFFVYTDQWHMFKCKAPSIEEVHRSVRGKSAISTRIVKATVWNYLETSDSDKIPYDDVATLLEEEFSAKEISKAKTLILKVISLVEDEIRTKRNVLDVYNKFCRPGATKEEVLRSIAEHVDPQTKKKVYSVLLNEGLLP